MTNKNRQASLDKQKYDFSELSKADMSGFMVYCEFCENQDNCKSGKYNYNHIKEECLCAKAYNRMKRSK